MNVNITLVLIFLVIHNSFTQEKQIETQSVLLDDLVLFIADNYSLSDSETDDDIETETKNITFLIETPRRNPSQEDVISLKQSFRFLSKRLSESDRVSIVAYSGMNGLVLAQTSPRDIKKILYTLDNFDAQIDKECRDGIAYAYEYADKNHQEFATNAVVMIRNPNPAGYASANQATNFIQEDNKPKKSGSAIIIAAITLLPEIISVIKD